MKWYLDHNGHVRQVIAGKSGENAEQQYVGTYENALKWFGVNMVAKGLKESLSPGWGKLENIIVFHQSSQFAAPKLSNELFDILVNAQREKKYWAAPGDREQNALDAIDSASKIGLVNDAQLLKTLESSKMRNAKSRIYAYEKWIRSG